MSVESRSWCFTLNNYSEEEYGKVVAIVSKYLVVGKEVGKEGTPHLQGFVYWASAKSLSAARKVIPRAHWEVTAGTAEQASVYCKKDGQFFESGKCPMSQKEKGKANAERWMLIKDLAVAGSWDELLAKFPSEAIVYHKQLRVTHADCKKRKREVDVIDGDEMPHEWFVGPPGTGKSRCARLENPGAYIKEPQSKWWDGYTGQEVVIIDDFDKYQKAQGGDMKRWMDRYPFQAEFKGGMDCIRPRKIVVTSNYRPEEIWDDEITVSAIDRRVKVRVFERGDTPWLYGNLTALELPLVEKEITGN